MSELSDALIEASINIILENQNANGAYIAAPHFSEYGYSWLRDGSFAAYAMLRTGRTESAERFLRWAGRAITRSAPKIAHLRELLEAQAVPTAADFLPARYRMDGTAAGDGWPAFQPDGYGAFLWCLGEHASRTGSVALAEEVEAASRAAVNYLMLVSAFPSYDCWEEFGDRVHPSTLACIYGGMRAAAAVYGRGDAGASDVRPSIADASDTATDPRVRLAEDAAREAGRLRTIVKSALSKASFVPKFFGSGLVDASLLWLSVPFGMLEPDEALMRTTVSRIERELLVDGGVKRYAEDTYYGGGRWILLSAWLGWYYATSGRHDRARDLLDWIESCANDRLELPEQVSDVVNSPPHVAEWIERWGTPATPLLWSHAMYLVLADELGLEPGTRRAGSQTTERVPPLEAGKSDQKESRK